MTHIIPRIQPQQALTMNATTLGGLPASHFLDCNNFVNCPTSILDFGITDGQLGDVLVTDGNGRFSFRSIEPSVNVDGGGAAHIFSVANANFDGINAAVVYGTHALVINGGTA